MQKKNTFFIGNWESANITKRFTNHYAHNVEKDNYKNHKSRNNMRKKPFNDMLIKCQHLKLQSNDKQKKGNSITTISTRFHVVLCGFSEKKLFTVLFSKGLF